MIKFGNEGFYFISKSGIKYDLYEGLTFGGEQRHTSDIIFIMLADERYTEKVSNHFVNWWAGASFFEKDIEEYNEDISRLVTEYEKANNIYKELNTMEFLPSGRTRKEVLEETHEALRGVYLINHEVMENNEKVKLLEDIVDLRVIIENL